MWLQGVNMQHAGGQHAWLKTELSISDSPSLQKPVALVARQVHASRRQLQCTHVEQHVFDLYSSISLRYRVRGFVRSRLADRTVRDTTARLSRALRFGGPTETMQGALVHHPAGPLLLGTQSARAARAVTVRACPPGRVWILRGLLDICGVFTVPVCSSELSCHPVLPLASTGHAVTCTHAAGNRTRRDRDL